LYIWAGDGDDQVVTGDNYLYQEVHGGNDDDNVLFGEGIANLYVYGDAGEDTIAPQDDDGDDITF
jgi:hypothetical protein